MTPRLSVIIATQGRSERLRRVLDGLAAQTEQCFEAITIGDGHLPSCVPQVGMRRITLMSDGTGAARVRNDALRLAVAPRTLVIDDDSVPHPETVAKHAQASGCLIGMRWHVRQAAVEALPDRVVAWEEYLAWIKCHDCRTPPESPKDWAERKHKQHTNAYTCHLSFPTEVAKQIGGFWEEMTASGYEDLEFALRLGRAGVEFHFPTAEDLPPVMHLDHPICSGQVRDFKINQRRYSRTLHNGDILERNGGRDHFRSQP